MSKPFLLFRGPVQTRSGYGAHSRDLLQALYEMNTYDIKIDSCGWGSTPMTALEKDNVFHKWIESNIISSLTTQPDVYVQVTVPNEFQRVGKINIGITAGIETTVAPKSWVDGCNKMDMIIATSQFSSEVLMSTVYNETINEDFAFLFVGHWLKGNLGQDRKDVGMLIKCFVEAFKNEEDKPALVLKTSSATFSIKQREDLAKKIKELVGDTETPPPIYLLFGELTDKEMNNLYNHSKIKAMVSLTKGEGFGRPLLEFTMTGKPVIASNWSGHKDFLPMDKGIMIGGKLNEVDESAIDDFILKGSKWFTANYNEAAEVMKIVKNDYQKFLDRAENLRIENSTKFSFQRMVEEFEKLLPKTVSQEELPKQKPINLPKLNKIK